MIKRLDYILCICASVIILFCSFLPVMNFFLGFSEDEFEAQAYTSITLLISCLLTNFAIIYFLNRHLEGNNLLKRWVKSVGVTAAGGVFIFWMYGIFLWVSHA